jgi:hypothetical protein
MVVCGDDDGTVPAVEARTGGMPEAAAARRASLDRLYRHVTAMASGSKAMLRIIRQKVCTRPSPIHSDTYTLRQTYPQTQAHLVIQCRRTLGRRAHTCLAACVHFCLSLCVYDTRTAAAHGAG